MKIYLNEDSSTKFLQSGPHELQKTNKMPRIDEVSYLHFPSPSLRPWEDKYREKIFPYLPNSVQNLIDDWINGTHRNYFQNEFLVHIISILSKHILFHTCRCNGYLWISYSGRLD